MNTDQTIDGVPRKWIEEYEALADLTSGDAQKLRALLDAPIPFPGYPPVPEDRKLPAAQPQGEPVAWVECSPAWLKAGGDCAAAPRLCVGRDGISHLHPAQAEQHAPVSVAQPEIVGRQCFPSEAMKAVHGYRKEPWVDGEVDQVPSEPGFYRVEPLVRLSDVTAPVAVVLPTRQRISPQNSHDWDEGHNDGWKAYENELKRLNPSL